MEIISPYFEICARIKAAAERSGRKDLPQLIAVSKRQPLEKLVALYHEGQRIFGENYVQELIEKKEAFEKLGLTDVDFQFIGHLQTNKVKGLLPYIQTIHSVDSLKLLQEIEKRAGELKKKVRVYLQLNIDGEASKGGFAPEQIPDLLKEVGLGVWVELVGWMTIPDPARHPVAAYQIMKAISDQYQPKVGSFLSMGMSDDFEIAIENGASVVRIGSALFGNRD